MKKDRPNARNRVLLIGATSFIANGLAHAIPSQNLKCVNARANLDEVDFKACDVVVNCALDPKFKTHAYQESIDLDLQVARYAARVGAHFVMLSSRKVYGTSDAARRTNEDYPTQPHCFYGRNKLESEQRIRKELKHNHTILRLGNIFGYELGRKSFLGMALTSLKRDQRVLLDMSPFVVRDFIPVTQFCDLVASVFEACPVGTFNLGSGKGFAVGHVGMRLIDGFGAGELVITRTDERDQFVLDVGRLREQLATDWPSIDLNSEFFSLGKQLRNA